jgi:hypothetical protein
MEPTTGKAYSTFFSELAPVKHYQREECMESFFSNTNLHEVLDQRGLRVYDIDAKVYIDMPLKIRYNDLR